MAWSGYWIWKGTTSLYLSSSQRGFKNIWYMETFWLTSFQLGDIFTVHAAGRKMTFLFDYHDSSIFFYSQFSSFQDAVQNFTISTGTCLVLISYNSLMWSVSSFFIPSANISVDSFYKHHSKIHDLFKGKLTSHHLPPFCSALSKSFHYYIHKTVEEDGEEMELIDFVRNSMFPAVFRQLFGDSNLQLSEVCNRPSCLILFM